MRNTDILKLYVSNRHYHDSVEPFVGLLFDTQENRHFDLDNVANILYSDIVAPFEVKYLRPITPEEFLVFAKEYAEKQFDRLDDENEANALADILTELTEPSDIDDIPIETALQETQDAIITARIRKHMMGFLENRNPDNSFISAASEDLATLSNLSLIGQKTHSFLGGFSDWQEYNSVERTKFPFRIQALNDITNDGIVEGSYNVMIASTGGGKSIFLSNLAADYFCEGHNVLYLTLELSKFHIHEILACILTSTKQSEVKSIKEDSVELLREKGNDIYIEHLPLRSTPTDVKNKIASLKKDFIDIDIVIIDYVHLMGPNKQTTGEPDYARKNRLAEELKDIAHNSRIPIWTAAQANREGMKSERMTLAHMADALGSVRIADFVIGLNQDSLDQEIGTFQGTVLKNRYSFNTGREFALAMNDKLAMYQTVVRQDNLDPKHIKGKLKKGKQAENIMPESSSIFN